MPYHFLSLSAFIFLICGGSIYTASTLTPSCCAFDTTSTHHRHAALDAASLSIMVEIPVYTGMTEGGERE